MKTMNPPPLVKGKPSHTNHFVNFKSIGDILCDQIIMVTWSYFALTPTNIVNIEAPRQSQRDLNALGSYVNELGQIFPLLQTS